jgi:hypothetical protein
MGWRHQSWDVGSIPGARLRSLIRFRLHLSSIATGRFNSPGPPFLSKAMSLACTLSVNLTSTIDLASHVRARRMENLAR